MRAEPSAPGGETGLRHKGKIIGSVGPAQLSPIPPVAATCFLLAVAGAVFLGKLPFYVLLLYLAASVVAFGAYWLDKTAARAGRARTPEKHLHLFALIGGWPGAVFAQRMFRHKSRKVEFQRWFWATVIANCVGLGWLLTNAGAAFLSAI